MEAGAVGRDVGVVVDPFEVEAGGGRIGRPAGTGFVAGADGVGAGVEVEVEGVGVGLGAEAGTGAAF